MQNLSCENDFFIIMQIKLIFTRKVLHLASFLRVRVFGTRKWPIHATWLVEIYNFSPAHRGGFMSLKDEKKQE